MILHLIGLSHSIKEDIGSIDERKKRDYCRIRRKMQP